MPHSVNRKPWRKLLWVKQDYPDNWVDPTFLNQLQRNVNVHPYDFYSLVADSTVVVQHLSSVVIFITSFIAIIRERVSPVSVVEVSTALTVAGWLIWDMGWEAREVAPERLAAPPPVIGEGSDAASETAAAGLRRASAGGEPSHEPNTVDGLGLGITTASKMEPADASYFPAYPQSVKSSTQPSQGSASTTPNGGQSEDKDHTAALRRTRTLKTAKSALLIYFTLLGLSPILRSLTTNISSDSIWAIATWLFIANCLGFDYGSGVDRKFPASFSTNAAITSSVVLASRLPTTTHVFSLILFSIEVFGLFPVFRRYVKHVSWNFHVLLTVVLVLGAAGGLGMVVGWGWTVVWLLGVIGGMGGCGWWMIDLQKYKNEIHGPWDPARPIIRRQWE